MMQKREEQDIAEIQILQALRNGETYAFDYLFEKYSKALYHFSLKLLKSSEKAEEIVQNVYLKIWEKRSGIDPYQLFRSYLFTIALNDIRKAFLEKAKENQFKEVLYDNLVSSEQDNNEGINFAYYLRILDEQIKLLPEKRKEIFLMHYKEGLTVTEIAGFLNISCKTAENQLTVALKSIREAFHERNIKGLYLFFIRCLAVHQCHAKVNL